MKGVASFHTCRKRPPIEQSLSVGGSGLVLLIGDVKSCNIRVVARVDVRIVGRPVPLQEDGDIV